VGSIGYFDHTADIGFRVTGNTLEDLFRTAAEGLFDYIVTNREEVRPALIETVSMRAEATDELLASWLNELIFRLETEHRLYSRFDVELGPDSLDLSAKIHGEPLDAARHELDHEVKAVTRHGLKLERIGEEWVAEMILDI